MKIFAVLFLGLVSSSFALNAPSNLTATTVSQSQINLAWRDNSGRQEDGFAIFLAQDGTNFVRIYRTGKNVTSFRSLGLNAGTRYWYRVRAFNSSTASAFSNTVSATTKAASPTPTPTPPSPTATPTSTPTPSPTPSITPTPTTSPSVSPSPSPTPSTGIAARYPNDKGIALDPAVVFADDFEGYTTPTEAFARWGKGAGVQRMRIATEPEHVFSGNKAIEYNLPVSSGEIATQLQHAISPTQDVLFARMYQKFASTYENLYGANHNGIRISAKYPGTAGTIPPADGTGFFLFLLQNTYAGAGTNISAGEVPPCYTHLYVYGPQQRSNFGDHWYPTGKVLPGGTGDWLNNPARYPDFKPYPMFTPQRDRWYCYELMVKANTIGKNDGEVKVWVDGKVIMDFPDLFMRSISTLKIDVVLMNLHNTSVKSPLTKWHDNVVMATQYIGPMVKTNSSPTPTPSTPTPTPTPSPTASPPTPTPTPSASPSPSPTASPTATPTVSPTPTPSPSPSPTVTPSPSPTPTPSPLPSSTPTATISPTPTATISPSPSPSLVSVVASWTSTPEDSYNIYHGTASGQYKPLIDAGPSDSFMISGLSPNTTYYFALTAVRAGTESPKSQETVYTTTAAAVQGLKLGKPKTITPSNITILPVVPTPSPTP